MSKAKQIEEMACDMCKACDGLFTTECEEKPCWDVRTHAKLLYNAGYRKQTEGKWLAKGDFFHVFACSVCGSTVDFPFQRTFYCPNCGANMKGGAEQ